MAIRLSACIATNSIEHTRDFYIEHFDAVVTFDCGWYVDLRIGGSTFQFITAEKSGGHACDAAGITLNLQVEDADAEYKRLTESGLVPASPIADHPWGDRSFIIQDPSGISVCIYMETEPDEEFRQYYK